MRCLSPLLHNPQWMGTMKVLLNSAITKPAWPSVSWETDEGLGPRRLEVNVIFTDPHATAAALKTAGSLARDLGACIRVRAAIAVPYALPLDKPPVSVGFIEELLSDLVCRLELDAFRAQRSLVSVPRSGRNSLACAESKFLGRHWWPKTLVAHGRASDGKRPFDPKVIVLFLSA